MNERHTRNRTNPPNSETPNGVAGRQGPSLSARDPYEKLRKLKEQFGSEAQWTLMQRYEFGLATQEAYNLETNHGTSCHGVKFFPYLSAALGLDEGLLRRVARFAESFKRNDAERLSHTCLSNGQPLAWSHVRRLLEVSVVRKRDELIRETVKQSWTSAQLVHAIQRYKGGKQNKGGRRPNAPEDLDGLIEQQMRTLEELINRNDKVWSRSDHSLLILVTEAPIKEVTAEVTEGLQKLRELHREAIRRLEQREHDARQALKVLQG